MEQMICLKAAIAAFMKNVNQMKPLLIDALRINMGGGLMLLDYLVDRLVERRINFVLLKDERCPRLRSEANVGLVVTMSAANRERTRYFKAHAGEFHCIFCFGNIPPAIRLNERVVTYFHNVSLLQIPKDYPPKFKILSTLKRWFINHYKRNTDAWVAQTIYTTALLDVHIVHGERPIYVMPFYTLPKACEAKTAPERNDYVYVGEHTKAKGHEDLLEAWRILNNRGVKARLHLTVTDPVFCQEIERAQADGVNVVNHRHIPSAEVAELYARSKATVYPSLNESLGLGIVEAAEAGCDVIGVNLPYMLSVCRPSELFNRSNPESIADAVMRYEQCAKPSTLLIRDMVDDLIDFLTQ